MFAKGKQTFGLIVHKIWRFRSCSKRSLPLQDIRMLKHSLRVLNMNKWIFFHLNNLIILKSGSKKFPIQNLDKKEEFIFSETFRKSSYGRVVPPCTANLTKVNRARIFRRRTVRRKKKYQFRLGQVSQVSQVRFFFSYGKLSNGKKSQSRGQHLHY